MKMEMRILDPILDRFGPPTRGTSGSAGYDLRACIPERLVLAPQQAARIGTGVAIHIGDAGLVGIVAPRSGLGSRGLGLANTIGIIDSDYTGEIICKAVNRNPPGGEDVVIEPGDRVFQLLFMPVVVADLLQVDAFSESTERGDGGYGSTGK